MAYYSKRDFEVKMTLALQKQKIIRVAGFKFLVVRTKLGQNIVNDKSLKLRPITEEKLIKMHWHNIKHKKIGDSPLIKCASWFLGKFKCILPFALLGLIAKLRRSVIKK